MVKASPTLTSTHLKSRLNREPLPVIAAAPAALSQNQILTPWPQRPHLSTSTQLSWIWAAFALWTWWARKLWERSVFHLVLPPVYFCDAALPTEFVLFKTSCWVLLSFNNKSCNSLIFKKSWQAQGSIRLVSASCKCCQVSNQNKMLNPRNTGQFPETDCDPSLLLQICFWCTIQSSAVVYWAWTLGDSHCCSRVTHCISITWAKHFWKCSATYCLVSVPPHDTGSVIMLMYHVLNLWCILNSWTLRFCVVKANNVLSFPPPLLVSSYSCAPTIRGLEFKYFWQMYKVGLLLFVPYFLYLPFWGHWKWAE